MSAFAQEVVRNLNLFRSDHSSIRKQCELVRLGLSRLRASDPFLKEIDKFNAQIDSLPKMKRVIINDELSEIAESELKKFVARKNKYKRYLLTEDLEKILPEYYLEEEPGLIADDGADDPQSAIPKILLNRNDKNKIGRKLLTKPSYTQVGIAHQVHDDENCIVMIFANEYAEEPPKPVVKEPIPTFEDIKEKGLDFIEEALKKYFEDKPEFIQEQSKIWAKEISDIIIKGLAELYPKGFKMVASASILEKPKATLNYDSSTFGDPIYDGCLQGVFQNEDIFCFAVAYLFKQDTPENK